MTAEDEEIAEYVKVDGDAPPRPFAALEERGDAEVDVNEALSKVDGDAWPPSSSATCAGAVPASARAESAGSPRPTRMVLLSKS